MIQNHMLPLFSHFKDTVEDLACLRRDQTTLDPTTEITIFEDLDPSIYSVFYSENLDSLLEWVLIDKTIYSGAFELREIMIKLVDTGRWGLDSLQSNDPLWNSFFKKGVELYDYWLSFRENLDLSVFEN